MARNESNYLVNKIDQDPSGSRTAKFLRITNGESDVKATADMGGQDVRQVLVLEAWPLNKYHGNSQKIWACGSFTKRLAMLGRNVGRSFVCVILVEIKNLFLSPEGYRRSPPRSPGCSSTTSPSPPSSGSRLPRHLFN